MNWSAIGKLVAPLLGELLNQVLVPAIQKLEDQIGNAAVKTVVEAVTGALEGVAGQALAAAGS